MMVPELVKNNVPVIVPVGHPAAILLSLRRMKWHIPNEHLVGRHCGGDVSGNTDGDIQAICGFWSGVYEPVIECLKSGATNNLFLALHETMFEDIEKFGRRLAAFLNQTDGKEFSAIQAYISLTTGGNIVRPSHRRQDELTRNSKRLAQVWPESYTSEELSVFDELIGADYEFLSAHTSQSLDLLGKT